MTALLEARRIEKAYAGKTALQPVDLAFAPAEIAALSGPNGAGKTTLLKILACIEYPDRGELRFQGRRLSTHGDWFRARRRVTMVDQNPYPFRGSVAENVAYGPRMRGRSPAELQAKVKEVLAAVGLQGFERRRAGALSGGEVQRMAIARAMACDPAILVLDEPTAHVDALRVAEVESYIKKLRDQNGVTVILATHDGRQACRLADRVLWLEDGELRQNGARVLEARLRRQDGRLIATIAAAPDLPPAARLEALELAGVWALIKLGGTNLQARVPREDLETQRPIPGEEIGLEAIDSHRKI